MRALLSCCLPSRRTLKHVLVMVNPRTRVVCALALTGIPQIASAQSVADFYKGKTIAIVVGSDAAGGYELAARTLAHHMARQIPGQAAIIVQSKPGARS